ncbi:MAG: PepSY domain-containing protein, partial [Parashewanella sp.]
TRSQSKVKNIMVAEQGAESLLNRARTKRWHFDANSGELKHIETAKVPDSINLQIYNVMSALHLQRYALPFQRALFFLSGVLGTLMVASGVHIWLKKRPIKNNTPQHERIGLTVAKALNVAMLIGLPAATVFAMWLNRLIPSSVDGRLTLEISGFFWFWLATLLYGFARSYDKGLAELSLLTGGLLIGLFIYNVHFLYSGLDTEITWLSTPVSVQIIDLFCFALGIIFIRYGYLNFIKEAKTKSVGHSNVRAKQKVTV